MAALRQELLRFQATGDPADVTGGKLTLGVIRELSRIVDHRAENDPQVSYLDGQELYDLSSAPCGLARWTFYARDEDNRQGEGPGVVGRQVTHGWAPKVGLPTAGGLVHRPRTQGGPVMTHPPGVPDK